MQSGKNSPEPHPEKNPDELKLGSIALKSRLLLGSGKYASLEQMKRCHEISGTGMVTVALRRVPLKSRSGAGEILNFIDRSRIRILPNTSGAGTGAEALRLAYLSADLGMTHLKIEVIAETKTLLPDPVETLRAVELIRREADLKDLFLMVYSNDDPILAARLVEAGADCVMPGGSPIGSGRGIANPHNAAIILELLQGRVPLILDAGIGCAADAAIAMEMGFDGVLLNSAVAHAKEPEKMAHAMKLAVEAGRAGFLAGRMPKKLLATASSPQQDSRGIFLD